MIDEWMLIGHQQLSKPGFSIERTSHKKKTRWSLPVYFFLMILDVIRRISFLSPEYPIFKSSFVNVWWIIFPFLIFVHSSSLWLEPASRLAFLLFYDSNKTFSFYSCEDLVIWYLDKQSKDTDIFFHRGGSILCYKQKRNFIANVS